MSRFTLLASFVWRFARWGLIAYLLLLVLMMWGEERLLFFPSRYPEGDWQPANLPVEDAWFKAADGVRLHGWYVEHPQPRAVVLFCHGNAGNITHRAHRLSKLRDIGCSALVFDYRGYGRSDGTPNEPGIVADGRAVRSWLAKRAGIAETQVVWMGESLGGAVAVDLAAQDGAHGLILESTFSSLPDVAAFHYPVFPARWLLRTRLDSAAKIGDYRGPLLLAHGDADRIVPLQFGRRLFDAANEPKRFVLLPGHDHNDPLPPDFYGEITAYLTSLPP